MLSTGYENNESNEIRSGLSERCSKCGPLREILDDGERPVIPTRKRTRDSRTITPPAKPVVVLTGFWDIHGRRTGVSYTQLTM